MLESRRAESVLGPVFITAYTASIGRFNDGDGVGFYKCADDKQIYLRGFVRYATSCAKSFREMFRQTIAIVLADRYHIDTFLTESVPTNDHIGTVTKTRPDLP